MEDIKIFLGRLKHEKITDEKIAQTFCNDKLSTTGTAAKATADASGNTITTSYASTIEISGNTMILKSKSGATLKSVTLPSSQPTWS